MYSFEWHKSKSFAGYSCKCTLLKFTCAIKQMLEKGLLFIYQRILVCVHLSYISQQKWFGKEGSGWFWFEIFPCKSSAANINPWHREACICPVATGICLPGQGEDGSSRQWTKPAAFQDPSWWSTLQNQCSSLTYFAVYEPRSMADTHRGRLQISHY